MYGTKCGKRFRAVLEPLPGGLGWVVAWLPFDVETTWKKLVSLRVKVEVGGEVFRTSLFPGAQREGHFVLVNKKMQKAAGAKVGAMVDFAIEPDLDAAHADGSTGVGEAAEEREKAGEVVRGTERADSVGDCEVDRWSERRGGTPTSLGADSRTADADNGGGEGVAAGA